jgi:hypothetical protein
MTARRTEVVLYADHNQFDVVDADASLTAEDAAATSPESALAEYDPVDY